MVHTVWSPGYGTRYMIYPIMWALALISVSILQSAQLPQEDQHPWVLQYFALIKLSSYFAVSYEHVLLRSSVPLPQVFEHIPDHSPHSLEISVHPEVTIFDKPYSIWYCKKCLQSTSFSLFWNETMNKNGVVCERAIWIQKWVCVVHQSFDCGLKKMIYIISVRLILTSMTWPVISGMVFWMGRWVVSK